MVRILLIVIVAGTIMACQSAQDKAAKSQEEVNRERLELVDKYQECIKRPKRTRKRRLSANNISRQLRLSNNSLNTTSEKSLKLLYLQRLLKNP